MEKDEFEYSVRKKFKEQGIELLKEYIHFIRNTVKCFKREKSFEFNIGHINIRGAIENR